MSDKRKLAGIIRSLKKTSPESWCSDVVKSKDGRNCLLGHLFDIGGNELCDWFENCIATTFQFYPVNDGKDDRYTQKTCKDRCVAYLEDIRDGRELSVLEVFHGIEFK